VLFVYLNDYLSQERGLSVQDATFIIALFGIGSAAGGIVGGFIGGIVSIISRSLLPLFMAVTTLLAVLPFLALLDDIRYDKASLIPCFYAFTGGCLAAIPSVNVRPIIIQVNLPEVRGSILTAANLIINGARGCGPTILTLLMGSLRLSRAYGFNIILILFWTLNSITLAILAKTLPDDQDLMETELKNYASGVGIGSIASVEDSIDHSYIGDTTFDGDVSLFSIDTQATAFDARAARGSLYFMKEALGEINESLSCCAPLENIKQSSYTELPE